jgi:hypothetical protein
LFDDHLPIALDLDPGLRHAHSYDQLLTSF